MVVQAVVKANNQSNGNGQISIPRGSKTPERFLMKIVSWVWPHMQIRVLPQQRGWSRHACELSCCGFLVDFVLLYSWDHTHHTPVDWFWCVSEGVLGVVIRLLYCILVVGIEQRASPIFGRVAIMLGIGPHSSCFIIWGVDGKRDSFCLQKFVIIVFCCWHTIFVNITGHLLLQLGELQHQMISVARQMSCRTPRNGFDNSSPKLR